MSEEMLAGLRPFLRILQGGLGKLKRVPRRCAECGQRHKPETPHDAESKQYQARFQMRHGRKPTWLDAMEHCGEEIQLDWVLELASMGVQLQEVPICK